ncbi:MAG: tyrosine-type recombinase/integrase [Nitrospiraceae bacterium]|nr:MAG: tyrosine-type recombinase/integrase [Nitrospiraceae bacterium]
MFRGIRIHRKVAGSKREALLIEAELKTQLMRNELGIKGFAGSNDVLFGDVASEYLDHVKKTKSKRTYELEAGDYNTHLKVFFSQYFISDIDNENLLRYQAMKKSNGYANRTVNIHLGLVRKIINYAVDYGYIKHVQLKYPMLREPKKLHAFLSPEEYGQLKKTVSYDLALKRIEIGRLTGMRPSELTYLSWGDIDFGLMIIRVQGKKEWKPKTDEERTIPLGKKALSILKELFAKKKSKWVFSYTDKPVKSIRGALATAGKKAGINKKVTPNMLRHTFATHALINGADLQSIMQIMGHRNIETTQRYLHAVGDRLRMTVELFDEELN